MELLRGYCKDQWSIRINDQSRICFRWEEHDAYDVEVTDFTDECCRILKHFAKKP